MLSRVDKVSSALTLLTVICCLALASCSSTRKSNSVMSRTEQGDSISHQKPLHEPVVRPYTWKEALEKNK